MIIVILFSFVAIFLTRLEEKGKFKNGMMYGFVLITLLGILRYNYGNDYQSYHLLFNEFTSYTFSWEDIMSNEYNREVGWVVLNFLFKNIGGFFMMVAVLSIFQNIVFYRFIKNNVKKPWKALALSIYLLTPQLYLYSFSMMRQALAITFFLLAWEYMYKRRIIISLLILLLGSSVHSSCQLLLPFPFLFLLPLNNKKVIAVLYLIVFIALYASTQLLGDVFNSLASMEELDSTSSIDLYIRENQNTVKFGLGFILNIIPYIAGIWLLFVQGKSLTEKDVGLILMALIGMLIVPFSLITQMISRFSIYFMAYGVAAMPLIYSKISNIRTRQILLAIFVFMLVTSYFRFFVDPVWQRHYSTFHTIFEVI